jgi:hypothetical protein
MYQTALKKFSRFVVRKSVFFLPVERQIAIERRHRGREQVGKLRRADCVIVSHGKSGRTWLRVMMSRVYQVMHGLPSSALLSFDNLHRKKREIPRIFFTHDNYVRDYTGSADVISDYGDRKVVFLARHPVDVAVSQFFQWKFRMKPGKKDLLSYPGHGEDVELFDFLMRPDWGLARVIDFMNLWARDMPRLNDFLLIRYEDLRSDAARILTELMDFIGTPATDEQIRDAVEFGSIENMRKMEQQGSFWMSGGRMKPKDRDNPESYKVRRAKVGGYRDYLTDEQAEQIASIVRETLDPVFGYERSAGNTVAPARTASA